VRQRQGVAIAVVLLAKAAAAQTVAGSVVFRDSTPIAGVIVVATDERGATAARGLTTERGDFLLQLPAAGEYRLRVLRIGYRPTAGPRLSVAAGATERVRIVFAGAPVSLDRVTVREPESCRVAADTGLAVTRVWEEARKAMLSTGIGTTDAPLYAEWIQYDRSLDSTARLVREQHVRLSRSPTTHAFRSIPAETLAARGYVVTDSGATTYHAPDADVLLSETFAGTHCFRLEAAANDPTVIGVAFQPTRERREMRELEGTFWLDRATAELRSLEFRYTNVAAVDERATAGGRVDFLRLHDGNWIIRAWNLRMPRLVERPRRLEQGLRRVTVMTGGAVLGGVQVTGGEVTRVTRRDSVMYAVRGAGLVLRVLARDTLVPAAGASVTLDGTDYASRADVQGAVRIAPVLPGHYRARIQSPLMDSLGVAPIERDVEVRAAEPARVDSIALPGARDLLARACPRDSVQHGEAMLRGTVWDERGNAIPHAAVTATWQRDAAWVGMSDALHLSWNEQTLGSLADEHGRWRICGVPRQNVLAVRVIADSGADVQRVRLGDDEPFGAVDLVARRRMAASAGEARAAVGEAPRARALIELLVTTLDGTALPDATLEVHAPDGPVRTVVTGSTGRALLPDVAPGTITVRARRIGFREGRLAVSVEAGRNTIPIVLSQVALPTLDTVRIIGGRVGRGRHDDFETRRLNQMATAAFTRADILKRNPVDLWQMLTNVPSMRVVDTSVVTAESTRGRLLANGSMRACYFAVMIDGILKLPNPGDGAFDLRHLPPTEDVYGVEIFAGPSSIPLQYGGLGDNNKWCGLIAIWTR
jgi:hypothetical protein